MRCQARPQSEMHGWAADHKQSHHPNFGWDSPTCHLYPCNPSLRSFFASADCRRLLFNASPSMELRCGAVDRNQSHRPSFGLDSPTFRFGSCRPSCSFLTSTSHSTGVLFLAVQLQRMLQSCAVGASVYFEAGRQAVSFGPCDCRFRVLQLCWQVESV